MLISFDIDDTLMMHGNGYPLDKNRVPWLLRLIFKERFRKGSYYLFKTILSHGHEIAVYTTSSRKVWYVKWWFRFYGVKLRQVINQKVHSEVVSSISGRRIPSKNPKKFGIDLHVDDLEGVAIEGKDYGFQALIIDPEDKEWCDKVLGLLENDVPLVYS